MKKYFIYFISLFLFCTPSFAKEDLNKKLLDFIYARDLILVGTLIHSGADINQGGKVLYAAAFKGDVEILKTLINAGADIKATKNLKNTTPVRVAAKLYHYDAADYLVSKGADIRMALPDDDTPALAIAAMMGNESLAESLIKEKFPLNDRDTFIHHGDRRGKTALMYAVERDTYGNYNKVSRFKIAEMLLKAGADPNIQEGHGDTALHLAVRDALPHYVKLLIEHGADVNIKNSQKEAPINNVRDMESLKLLVQAGADVNNMTHSGSRALGNEYVRCSKEAQKLLKSHNAELGEYNGSTIFRDFYFNKPKCPKKKKSK